ncbi:hypothetical protein [Paraglaciecola arctica]|uniref:Pentapeptide MXKDX repeat protein n=1 Tax=Paraglaciecola arctica BSs20135 TaxID=493475 RepID=K6Y6D2_9ALTE|nr:hypothetical protein [Paraglaciecola arctica]GAC19531.1 hypothetical protein GARC_2565 [Paraglaciecola arctica BSs20135]
MKTNLIKTISKIALVLIPTLTLSMTASAHDPKLHAKKPEKADCSKMDHSKMDMKDPVAMAMMKKCMKQAEASSDKMDGKMDHSKMMDDKMDDKDMKKDMKKDEHDNH